MGLAKEGFLVTQIDFYSESRVLRLFRDLKILNNMEF